jgi:hypothetical protein
MNECCQNLENRLPIPDARPDVTVTVCGTCGRRHIELAVDPGVIGVKVGSG